GGYIDAQYRFERENGVTDEATFVLERFNVFTFTPVSDRVRVASELEIEEGGEEIKLELATVDFEAHPSLNLRAGMILSPLGKFNLAHDSPANDLTDRPLVSVELLGVTLSEPGMGVYGSLYPLRTMRVTYEAYAVNGFHDGVIEGVPEGTRVAAGKGNFEDNNANPAFVGRIAANPVRALEIGASAHTGIYNSHTVEGLAIDDKRRMTIYAADWDARVGSVELIGEYARVQVETPVEFGGLLQEDQQGFYVQLNGHFLAGVFPALPQSRFTGVARFDWVDFDANGDGDDHRRITLGINFRPVEDTVFKLDWQRDHARDPFLNPSESASILFSAASYF
ncbi:MAG: hypothetical protein O3A46_06565, partial [Candidatus Poribacteria bacterium]|nr:hypothetical protein [Candidatus Poribacteria bacterium]